MNVSIKNNNDTILIKGIAENNNVVKAKNIQTE